MSVKNYNPLALPATPFNGNSHQKQRQELLEQQPMVIRQAVWYRKDCATFSDTIALVRRHLWHSEDFWISGKPPDMTEIPRPLFDCLIDTLGYAP